MVSNIGRRAPRERIENWWQLVPVAQYGRGRAWLIR